MFFVTSISSFDNISMVGMFDECQVTSASLCTGWHERGTDWLRPSHDNISQAVSGERERGRGAHRVKIVRSVKSEECCTTGGEGRPSQLRVPVWGQAL